MRLYRSLSICQEEMLKFRQEFRQAVSYPQVSMEEDLEIRGKKENVRTLSEEPQI
jgi:hypothetical protein